MKASLQNGPNAIKANWARQFFSFRAFRILENNINQLPTIHGFIKFSQTSKKGLFKKYLGMNVGDALLPITAV